MKYVSYVVKFLLIVILIIQSTSSFAQQVIVGTVKDSKGSPLDGATITLRGTNTSTSADANGQFKLGVNQLPPFYIRGTFVGFKPQDFQVLRIEQTPLELTLVDDALLEEIVVTSRRRS